LTKLLASCLVYRYCPAIEPEEERPVSRLIIAIVVGIVIAVGAVAVVENVLSGASNGNPSNASLYQYGTR
jgi:hypothetical protein